SPPATLSEAIWLTTSPPSALRSTVITGTSWELADSIAVTTASESTGLTSRTSIFCCNKSSISLNCVDASSCASVTTMSYPASSAAASAPSRNVTKNGLFKVEMDRPIFTESSEDPSEFSPPSSDEPGLSVEQALTTSNNTAKSPNLFNHSAI